MHLIHDVAEGFTGYVRRALLVPGTTAEAQHPSRQCSWITERDCKRITINLLLIVMLNNLQRKVDLGVGGIFLGKCLAAFCLSIFNTERDSSINKWIKGEMSIFATHMS